MGQSYSSYGLVFFIHFVTILKKPILVKVILYIHDGVWIGMRAMIMPGVTIGEGAIIAANSVVTKDVAPYIVSLVEYRLSMLNTALNQK